MNRYRLIFPALALALMTFAAYAPAFRAGYVWDDDMHLTENAAVASPDALRQIWTHGTPSYYPLTFTTFWVERKLWGLDPAGYHLVNIALHAANCRIGEIRTAKGGEFVELKVPGGEVYFWAAGHGLDFRNTTDGSDVQLLFQRCITVTPLHSDMTNRARLAAMVPFGWPKLT